MNKTTRSELRFKIESVGESFAAQLYKETGRYAYSSRRMVHGKCSARTDTNPLVSMRFTIEFGASWLGTGRYVEIERIPGGRLGSIRDQRLTEGIFGPPDWLLNVSLREDELAHVRAVLTEGDRGLARTILTLSVEATSSSSFDVFEFWLEREF